MKSEKNRTTGPVLLALILAGALTCGLIAYLLFSDSPGERIFLLSNEQIKVDGYDGNGKVSEDFHPENYGIGQIDRSLDHADDLISSITCGAYPSSGLSNDDIVTYSCTYDHGYAAAAGIQIERFAKAYRVSGLTPYTEVDLFDGVSGEWSDNPDHPVSLHIPEQYTASGIRYIVDFGGEAYNGHSVFIHLEVDVEKLHMFGMTPAAMVSEMEMGPMPDFPKRKKKTEPEETGGMK